MQRHGVIAIDQQRVPALLFGMCMACMSQGHLLGDSHHGRVIDEGVHGL